MNVINNLKAFWSNEAGGEAVEWPFVVALVVVGIAVTWGLLGDEIVTTLTAIITELQGVNGGGAG